MRWAPQPPRNEEAWYWIFAFVRHRCDECKYFFWLERGMRKYHIRFAQRNDLTPRFLCYRCGALATAAAALPAP